MTALRLPIDPHLPRIVEALRERRGLVLVAEPGAGKTTRVPRALLDAGFRSIVVVEPRRIAARMAADRVAEELGERAGGRVGYRVRFDARVGKDTVVTFVTEGILARQLDRDPTLASVEVVVFDELHERHLETDLALARARRQQQHGRSELHIVAMSATLEAEPVAAFLDAPIIEVEGRAHPVEVRFQEKEDDRPLERRVRAAVVRLLEAEPEGDVLVFLPGAREIRAAMESCAGPAKAFDVDLLPLHGDLPAAAQDRAVRRGGRRKVILSTNVAETSLTIDGVTAVVDSGLARMATTSPFTGLSRLDTQPVSRASLTQRAGRAGRTRPGVCVCLFTKRDHARRDERDPPEIARTDLTRMALSLRVAGFDPRTFPYLEAPPDAAIDAADRLLSKLSAVDDAGAVTDLGRAMLRIPAHPRIARVALEAARRGHRDTGAQLAALIQERDVRLSARAQIGKGRKSSSHEVGSSDLLACMDRLDALSDRPSAAESRALDLDPHRVRTVRAAERQIQKAIDERALEAPSGFDTEEDALLLATLAGFPDRVARRKRPGSPQLMLGGGTSATLDENSVVKEGELLVVVDAQQRAGGAIVFRASVTSLEHLMELFLDRIEETTSVRFDADRERIEGFAELRYEGVVVERTAREPSDDEAAPVLAKAALTAGLRRFCDIERLGQLEARLAFASQYDETVPRLEQERLEEMLRELARGRRSFAELADAGLLDGIRASLGAALSRTDRLAPEHVAIPGRSRVPVRYELNRPPFIESRLQDFFSAEEGPRIAGGKEPLVLHLLAPNKRAVQVTTDLAGFWERHYPAIQKELRRRYPRHAWPDDPLTAQPSKPARRRRK